MPKSKSTVPKFGVWHESQDIAYSLAFDKAHIEREYSLHIPEEDENDRIRFKNMLKQREMQMQNQNQSNVILDRVKDAKHGMKIVDTHENKPDSRSKRDKEDNPSSFSGYGSFSSYSPSVSSFGNPEKHGQVPVENDHVHESYHRREPTEHKGNADLNSQQRMESSGVVADKSGKTAVPRFGNWDLKDPASSGEFSIIFNKVREERSPKPTKQPQHLHTNTKVSRSPQHLYANTQVSKVSNVQKTQRGWSSLCCFQPAVNG